MLYILTKWSISLVGIGESIRGGAMDFVDSATGTGGDHVETHKGAREAEQGIARMETGNNKYNATTGVTGATTTGAFAGSTQTGTTNPQNTAAPVQNTTVPPGGAAY